VGVILTTLRGGAGTHCKQQGGGNEASVNEPAKVFTHDRIALSGDDESLLYSWFAEDYETSGFLCQAGERQKAQEVLMVSG